MTKLIVYRKQARLRQFDLGQKLGVTEQLISKWETGRSEPSWDQKVDIARILGATPEEIFVEI